MFFTRLGLLPSSQCLFSVCPVHTLFISLSFLPSFVLSNLKNLNPHCWSISYTSFTILFNFTTNGLFLFILGCFYSALIFCKLCLLNILFLVDRFFFFFGTFCPTALWFPLLLMRSQLLVSLYVMSHISLTALKTFSLSLPFNV